MRDLEAALSAAVKTTIKTVLADYFKDADRPKAKIAELVPLPKYKDFWVRYATISDNKQRYLNVKLEAACGQKTLLRFYLNGTQDVNDWNECLAAFLIAVGLPVMKDTDELVNRGPISLPDDTPISVQGLAGMLDLFGVGDEK